MSVPIIQYNVMATGSRSMILREDRKEIYAQLRDKVLAIAESHPNLCLITGMAEGWDEALAKVGYREGIPYSCFIPNPTYGNYYWGKNSKLGINRIDVYNKLLAGAADVGYCCDSIYEDGEHSNFVRNRMMVAAADHALVYNPSSSGTAHAMRLIKAQPLLSYEVYPFPPKLFN